MEKQIEGLPASVDFVVLTLHHPPVADIQKHIEVDHNPRENEIALRDYLSKAGAKSHARFLVSAGHIHNYERHVVDDVTYLVSGGVARSRILWSAKRRKTFIRACFFRTFIM